MMMAIMLEEEMHRLLAENAAFRTEVDALRKERDEAIRDEHSAVTKLNTVRGELQGQRDENKTILEDVWRLQKERDEARAKSTELNRRCQVAEAGIADAVRPLGGRTLGRALANAAAMMMLRRAEAAEKREATLVAAIEEHLRAYDLDDEDTREEMAALIDAVTLEAGRGET